MSDKSNISPTGGKHIPEDKLMAYLEGRLSPAEQHEVELLLANEGMESDALEGLKTIDATDARQSVIRLNHKLRNNLRNKKRMRRKLPSNQLTWIAIVVILFLAIVAYLVIKRSL